MKIDIKKLQQTLADKKKAGLAKLDKFNALVAISDPTEAQKEEARALNADLESIEADVRDLGAQIAAEEKTIIRQQLFSPAATAARAALGHSTDPERTFGFRHMAEFGHAVAMASMGRGVDPRLIAGPTDFNQNAGAAGEGWLVAPEYRDQVWEIAFDPLDLLGRVDMEPTNSNAVMVPKDETTPWGATGVQAAWRAEAGAMTVSKAALTGELMPLHELYAFCVATNELLEDAPRLEDRLTRKAGMAIRWKGSDTVMWGDGNGKPRGFMDASNGSLITVAKETNQAANTLVVANLFNMFAHLQTVNGGSSAMWLADSSILPQLGGLVIGQQPVWTPSGTGMQNTPGGVLLGKPLLFTDNHNKTLGTVGDLTLIEPMGYYAARKATSDLSFATSMHLYFDLNMQAFRWTFRMGGQPYLKAPITYSKSNFTKSHFVALATRS